MCITSVAAWATADPPLRVDLPHNSLSAAQAYWPRCQHACMPGGQPTTCSAWREHSRHIEEKYESEHATSGAQHAHQQMCAAELAVPVVDAIYTESKQQRKHEAGQAPSLRCHVE
jgi:hypothetical protein